MKFILDLLTHPSQPDIYVRLLGYLAMMLGLYLIWAAMGKLTGYAQSMQNEILQKKLSVMMMDKALTADLSMFDNPSYYDKFDKVQNDSRSLSYITWSAIDCLSNLISFLSAFLILCTSNIWFGLLMTAAAIPSAIAGQKYTKAVYSLEKEQVNELRKKGYLSFLATSKHYAQDVRLFHLGPYLKDKFEAVWLSAYLKEET